MEMNRELKEALIEETEVMQEMEGFKLRFIKLIENYMEGMGTEAEIAEIIDMVLLAGDEHED